MEVDGFLDQDVGFVFMQEEDKKTFKIEKPNIFEQFVASAFTLSDPSFKD